MRARKFRLIGSSVLTGIAIVVVVASAQLLGGCGGNTPRTMPSAEDSYAAARQLYENHKWSKARLEFEQFIFGYSGATLVDSAQYFLAMCYFHEDDYILAADEFYRLRRRYPTSPLVEEADYLRGFSLLSIAPGNPSLDQEQTATAIRELKLFKDLHPISRFAPSVDSLLLVAFDRLCKGDFKIARLYHRMGRYGAARIYWQEVIDRCSESSLVPDAVFYIGEGYFKRDSLDRAIESFEKLIYLFPDHARTETARKRVVNLHRRREQLRAMETDDG